MCRLSEIPMGRAPLDIFAADAELFGAPLPVYSSDPERVRARLRAVRDEMRNAGEHGPEPSRRRLLETIVPEMTLWLPEDEAGQFRQVFGAALARGAASQPGAARIAGAQYGR